MIVSSERSVRRTTYKQGIDFDSGRKRRNGKGLELRKNRKQQGLRKRRSVHTPPAAVDRQDETNDMKVDESQVKLPQFLCDLNPAISDSVIRLLTISTTTKTSTSINVSYRVDSEINAVDIKKMVVESGVVPILVNHLSSNEQEIREQSAICLGNLAGEMSELRDHVIQCGVIPPILHNINNPSDEKFLEKIVWSLSNLCRGKQTSEMNNIIPVFPVLVKLLSSTHCETLLNACWAFTYLTEENDTVVKALKEENLIPQFVSLLTHENTKITHVALRILGNFMLSGYVQEVIDCGIMNYINALFTSNDKHVKCEICYLLSLIAENGEENISLLINSSSELRTLINMMQYGMLSEKMEATWVMFNLANKGTDLQLRALADMAAIPALCQNLDVQDIKFILLVLDSIENFLMVGDRLGLDYKRILDECGGREKLETLISHQSDDVYRKSNFIYEEYFEERSIDEGECDWDYE